MRHRQVVLLGRGGLDDNAQALHAVDGDPVAAGQEHCGFKQEKIMLQLCGSAFFALSCHSVKSIIRCEKRSEKKKYRFLKASSNINAVRVKLIHLYYNYLYFSVKQPHFFNFTNA